MHNDNQLQKDLNELIELLFNSSNPNESVKMAAEIIQNETKGANNND